MIVTPLDSALLNSKTQYVFYHKMVDFALKELVKSVKQNQLCNTQELKLFTQYSDLLLYSINAMRIKYMYDDESSMKIDLTDSGFPNYLEFRYLFNDLELGEHYRKKLTAVSDLKAEFLDTLMRKKEPINKRKLFQAASIVYYSSVKQKYIFNRFVQGKIIKSPQANIAKYLVSWSFYDVSHNRPYICFMYFDYDGKDPQKIKTDIYETLKQSADREMKLDAMAYAIDRKLEDVFPRLIKRFDLGPLHNVFAKDENKITHAILSSIAKKEIPLESFAVSLKLEEVKTKGEFKEGNFFNKQTFQKWDTIYKQKFVFAPHRVIQLLYSKLPNQVDKLSAAPFQVDNLPS